MYAKNNQDMNQNTDQNQEMNNEGNNDIATQETEDILKDCLTKLGFPFEYEEETNLMKVDVQGAFFKIETAGRYVHMGWANSMEIPVNLCPQFLILQATNWKNIDMGPTALACKINERGAVPIAFRHTINLTPSSTENLELLNATFAWFFRARIQFSDLLKEVVHLHFKRQMEEQQAEAEAENRRPVGFAPSNQEAKPEAPTAPDASSSPDRPDNSPTARRSVGFTY